MKVPVHVIGGFLGAGKTTAILRLVRERAGRERCAVIVNDFGEARVDATLLEGAATVSDIPGGCVCCTAPENLARTISGLLDDVRPDRLFIEPSGLARPQDVLDMLARGGIADRVAIQPTVILVDPAQLEGAPDVLGEQLEAADVLVANRCDLATDAQVNAFRTLTLWPGPLLTAETTFGVIPEAALEWPDGAGPRATSHHHDHDHDAFVARSWVWPKDVRFAWDRLRALLHETPGVARFKGIFFGDLGWFRLDWAGGRVHVAATAWRRDSRADLIADSTATLDRVGAGLAGCHLTAAPASGDPTVELVDADGYALTLTREALAALPGQVPDVATIIPGRQGSGVRMRELFALVPAPTQARFVLCAQDGLTTAPAPVLGIGDAILVHSLGPDPLPGSHGGPFRVLAPAGEACANVKGLATIRVVP